MLDRLKKIFRQEIPQKHNDEQPTIGLPRIANSAMVEKSVLAHNTSVAEHCYLYNTSVGEFSYLAAGVSVMNTKIGKFCSIANGVIINGGRHPSKTFVSTSPVFFSVNKQCGSTFADKEYFKEMGNGKIGNDVWIGAKAVIMDDLVIGDGAIIGAGAIVTKNVEPYSIVVGNPAKHVRYRFSKEEIEYLMAFKWWDKDEQWLRENYMDFHDVKLFCEKYRVKK